MFEKSGGKGQNRESNPQPSNVRPELRCPSGTASERQITVKIMWHLFRINSEFFSWSGVCDGPELIITEAYFLIKDESATEVCRYKYLCVCKNSSLVLSLKVFWAECLCLQEVELRGDDKDLLGRTVSLHNNPFIFILGDVVVTEPCVSEPRRSEACPGNTSSKVNGTVLTLTPLRHFDKGSALTPSDSIPERFSRYCIYPRKSNVLL